MPTYRLYRLDGAGQIIGADWIEAPDEDQARAACRREAGSLSYEIWDRDRLVERVRPAGGSGGPPPSQIIE